MVQKDTPLLLLPSIAMSGRMLRLSILPWLDMTLKVGLNSPRQVPA